MYETIGLNGLGETTNHAKGFKTVKDAMILVGVMMHDLVTLAIEVYDYEGKVVVSRIYDDGGWYNRRIADECKSKDYIPCETRSPQLPIYSE
jgi:hypothetical protein